MIEFSNTPPTVEPPRGSHAASVDEKGRLKLPAPFKRYVESFGEKRVFVTSLDLQTVGIYPTAVWRDVERFFETQTDDPEDTEDLFLIANGMGADCEMDEQGRVLIHQELRRKVNLEGQPVRVDCYKGLIKVRSQQMFEDRFQQATEGLADKLKRQRGKGLKW